MKRKWKRKLALCMIIAIIGTMMPNVAIFHVMGVKAAVTTGSCGTNLTYTLDSDTGILTVSGTGDMNKYYDYSDSIFPSMMSSVIIEDGVTSVGSNTFAYRSISDSVTIASSVKIFIRALLN